MTKQTVLKKGMSVLLMLYGITAIAQQGGRIPVINDQAKIPTNQTERLQQPQAQKVIQKMPSRNNNREIAATADVLINNNNGSNTIGRFTQSESSMLSFGNYVVVSYNDAGSNATAGGHFTGWSYSSDGGVTFTDGGVLPNSAGGDAGDPVLARNNTTGRIYLATLGFNSGNIIQVFRSDDNAITWQPPVNAISGGSSEDKEWIVVDNFAGSGNGNLYVLSRNFGAGNGIYFSKSTDNGSTFSPTILVASGGAGNVQGAYILVGPDHSIYAFWYTNTKLQMRRSTDQGATFSPAVIIFSGLVGGTNGDLGLTGIRQGTATPLPFRSSEFPHAAVNPVTGQLYVVFDNNPAGIDKADVFVVTSTNAGATWTPPIRVNDDATTTDQWQPTISVSNDGTRMGIFYYSRQEDASNNNLFKYYGRMAEVSGPAINFLGTSFAVSDVSSLPEFGRDNVINSVYMGDYNTATATPGFFHVAWSDNRDDLAGGGGRKDPNMYYKKVAFQNLLPGANINVSPVAINFGEVSVGQTAGPNVVSISNIGDQPLTISGITTPGGEFTLSGLPSLPITLASFSSVSFNVSFSPISGGPKAASFNIISNAVNTPTATVNLQGFGLTPTVINVTPSPLVINVPYNGTGSGVLNISNPAFAHDLNWVFNDLDVLLATNSDNPGGPAFSWINITGDGTLLTPLVNNGPPTNIKDPNGAGDGEDESLGDDNSVNVPLPFIFRFFGNSMTSVDIASNGYLTFGSSGNVFTNTSIPNPSLPNNLIAPFWDDLDPTAGGTVHYRSSPTQFIVQYTGIKRFGTSEAETFEVILNADGSIVYQYLTMTGGLNSSTVGIENATGTAGIQVAFNTAFVHNNLAVRFAHGAISTCPWITSITPFQGTTPGGTTSTSTIGVNATGLNCGTYNCSVKITSNATNTPILVVPVVLNVQSAFNCSITSIPSNNTYTGGVPTNLYLGYGPQSTTLKVTVTPAGSYTYSWSPATGLNSATSSAPVFTPTAAGTYTFTVTVTGAGTCSSTCSITIHVYDIRVPGTNGKKVYLCHAPPDNPANAHTLEVSVNAVNDHLTTHPADHLGSCSLVIASSNIASRVIAELSVENVAVKLMPHPIASNALPYPNPSKGSFDLLLNNYKAGNAEIRVLNSTGSIIETRNVMINNKGQILHFDLKNPSAGMYFIQIITSDGIRFSKIMINR